MKRSAWMMVLLFAGLVSGCAYQHRLLVNPQVNVPAATSMSTIKQAVSKALISYGWTVDKEESGVTLAHLKQDNLFASIRVDYNETRVSVNYVESQNFRYQKSPDGVERIHSHYLLWVNNIAEKINEILTAQLH